MRIPPAPACVAFLCLIGFPDLAAMAGPPSGIPPLILSEILADPAALPDAQGEFLELACPRADSVALESVSVSVDGRSLFLGALRMGPGDCFLLCRDSAAYAGLGIRCGKAWEGMSLANSRPLAAALGWVGGGFDATAPASRPGVSWENTRDAAAAYAEFRPSRGALAGGDSATPGFRVDGGAGTASPGPSLASLEAIRGSVQVTVAAPGPQVPGSWRILLRLDGDWDGVAERGLDSVRMEDSGPYPRVFRLDFPADARGRLEAALVPDGPAGGSVPGPRSLVLEPEGFPFAFGSFRADPAPGEPEWLEIRNATGGAGSQPRKLGSESLSLDAQPLGLRGIALGAGESVFLTPDTAAFRARFGAIKARLARPDHWRALRNAGDTLVLSACGIPADTLAWGPVRAAASGPDAGPLPERDGWSLSGRSAFPSAPLDVEVRAREGAGYALRAFDLEGQCVREIGKGGAGRRTHTWDGRGEGGRPLPRGAYVLGLSFDAGPTLKRAVAAGER